MEIPSTGEQFNLKWNNHQTNFVQTFVQHRLGESLVDVTLSCEGNYIKTHRLILSACSDYFHRIFQDHAGLQHPIIFLNGVRYTDIKYILDFMYHGEVKVLDKDLPNVLSLGESLQIKGLSSVKLRGVDPEEVSPSPPPRPRKHQKKEQNSKDKKQNVSSKTAPTIPVLPKVNTISEETQEELPLFDNGDRTFPKIMPNLSTENSVDQTEVLPIITSVSSVPSTPKIDSPFQNGESAASNNSSLLKERPTPPPKPPHAFMIFANEWRKKLTVEHPEENRKEISVRLGNMWKNLLPETKNIYYREAQRADEEYKLKYPNYVNPSESLKRKADVLNDATNTSLPTTSASPTGVCEAQDLIAISDSD